MSCSREGDGLLEPVVVPDRMDGLHQSATGPGGRDGDTLLAGVEQTAYLEEKEEEEEEG